jgi:ssDNA-binding Zn-finger/Zn-ribbon topoisomerase 1
MAGNKGRPMTDEELESIKLEKCPSCGSRMTSVRKATARWWFVGCIDCFNKIQCERTFVERAAEKFNEYARRINK